MLAPNVRLAVVGVIMMLMLQGDSAPPTNPLDGFDGIQQIFLGSTGLTAWLIWDCIRLRKENERLNLEARETARSSIEAMVRMATERK